MAVGGAGASIFSVAAGRVVVNLLLPAADLITELSAGAKVYLERDTTSAFGAPTVVSSTALTSGVEQLEFVDSAGTSSSWYRVRVGNSGGTTYTDYSTGMQATSLLAYATLDDLLETMSVAPSDTAAHNALADMLVDSASLLNKVCGRDFFRHPQVSGDEVRYYHIKAPGHRTLRAAVGEPLDIISITTLEIAAATGESYTTITAGATGYYLMPENRLPGESYTDIVLSSTPASYPFFPWGERVVKATGAFGFTTPPSMARRANIDLAREWFRSGPGGGGPVGVNQFGTPVFGPGTPATVIRLYELYGTQRGRAYVG